MTIKQSVDLIDHAILHAESGDIVIPHLVSMRVIDLMEIFSEMYNKPIHTTNLRPGEKMMESLINETQSMRIVKDGEYTYIKPSFKNTLNEVRMDYNSTINPIDKESLRKMLQYHSLL